MSERETVTIVVPNYNGRQLLAENLPALVNAAKQHNPANKIIVVDDASNDGSADFIGWNFTNVEVLRLEKNKGFGAACNAGITSARTRIVLCLNNDVRVTDGFIEPLLHHFMDPSVFAVQAVSRGEDNRKHKIPAAARKVLYACAGYCAYDRDKFIILGGFHPLYNPFYCEDRDIGYRAWKRGWKNIADPRSIVYHKGECTTRRFQIRYKESVKFRNRIVFILTCYDDPLRAAVAILLLLFRTFYSFRWYAFLTLVWLWKKRHEIRKKRAEDIPFWKLNDSQIQKILENQ